MGPCVCEVHERGREGERGKDEGRESKGEMEGEERWERE